MDLYLWILILVMIMNLVFGLSLIFFERKEPTTTWAWLLIFTLLPGIGFLIYLILGQNLSREKLFNEKTEKDEGKRRRLRDKFSEEIKGQDGNDNYTDLMVMNFNHSGAEFTTGNEVDVYVNGEDKFKQLLHDIKNAKRYIHIQYYIFKKDLLGKEVMKALEEKLDEGIEVRFLIDDMGSRTMDNMKVKNFIKKGGKYAVFFPGRIPHLNTRINYRNHRKIVVIDGEYGYTGGFNIGKEYINKDKKVGFWRDTHIRIRGKAVNALNHRFLLDWCYASGEQIDDLSPYLPENQNNNGDVSMQIVTSGPDHKEEYIKIAYMKMINNAKRNVYITSPYFVPDEPMLEAIKISALSGVDVRLMIPGNPDHFFMEWAASAYIGELLEAGVKVYSYRNGFIHAKTLVADSSVMSIGTANMDMRSFRLNFEVNAFIYDKDIATNGEMQFEKDMKDSVEITMETYLQRSIWKRMKESVIRLLAPIL